MHFHPASVRSSRTISRRAAVVALGAVLSVAGETRAQDAPAGAGYVTRAELERQAATAAGAEAAAIRERLRDGDFRVGDRIVISTRSSATLPQPVAEALNDTLVVREGRTIRIPNVPDFSLAGILRSELEDRLNTHLKGYLRNVDVRVETLVQANISGPVGRPGFTVLAPDMLLTDAIMAGGGIARDADVNRTVIKRDGEVVIDSDSLSVAMQRGATLDQIDFQTNDEIAVGERRNINWRTILTAVSAVASAAFLIIRLTDR
jgi:protein involved in polysaccharide export with SLBB domain